MPRIKATQMQGNHRVTGDWCPGCGLYAYVNNGEHRDDCMRGHHGHHRFEPCTDRCDQSTTVIHNGDDP